MKNKYLKAREIKSLSLMFMITISLGCASISNCQPQADRRWETVNNYSLGSEYITNSTSISVAAPTGDGVADYHNIAAAIEKSRTIHATAPTKYVVLNFAPGNYVVNQSIILSINKKDSYLIFEGAPKLASGLSATTINFSDQQDTAKSYLFEVNGSNAYPVGTILSYNKTQNSVTLATTDRLQINDIVDIVLSNGSWHNNQKKPDLKNYFGQINRVKSINNNNVSLELNFADTWKFKESGNSATLSVFKPIKYIGFENIALKYQPGTKKSIGSFMKFQNSAFCWVKGDNFYKPLTSHIGIGKSFTIQVSDSYFNSSYKHGGGGQGYGVAIGDRSSNCKIENNIFDGLRHSMVISAGANNNVFGYNYSLNQTAQDNEGNALYGLGDISVHGFYPYDNLFEGNIVDMIRADEYWGGNGGNTFFRNYVKSKQIVLEKSNDNTVVANLGSVKIQNMARSLVKGNSDGGAGNGSTDRASYYYSTAPDFVKTANMPWPLIDPNRSNLTDIPAKRRFNKLYAKIH